MTQRTAEDFKRAAAEQGITKWTIHRCGFCDYPCGFVIRSEVVPVWYDSGCHCSDGPLRPSSWEYLAEHYNRNQPERNARAGAEFVARMDSFWGFSQESHR